MKAPKFLGKTGKAKWKELLSQLPDLKRSEYDSLALLCASWQTYLSSLGDIQTTGTVLLSEKNGRLFVNPNVNVNNECWKQIVKLSKLFGLEPNKRATVAATDDDSQWEGILDEGEK